MQSRTLPLLVATAALLAASAFVVDAPDEVSSPSAAAVLDAPVGALSEAVGSITVTLEPARAMYGSEVQASGSVSGAVGGESVVLELLQNGLWTGVASAPVDITGSFGISFAAMASGPVRARLAGQETASAEVPLAVVPSARVQVGKSRPFTPARVTVRIEPASYSGRVVALLRQDGRTVARRVELARAGRAVFEIPTPGVGVFWLEVVLTPDGGLAERSVGAKVTVSGRRLSLGSRGPDVRALRARLAELAFFVPGPTQTFDARLYDSVIAFQKAYRLDRTGTVDRATWRMLGRAKLLRPRFRAPAQHIEIDKTRQILLKVKNGRILAILPASTGATGNTPEGRHSILWKAPATTTWLGSGILYRTMTFVGNSFAIHGWSSVPAYPASHGCVRIPIWTADWLYERTPVGETVDVYR